MRPGRPSPSLPFGTPDPRRLQADLQHAISFLKARQPDKALQITTRLVAAGPKIGDFQFVHGSALDELGRPQEAIDAYQQAVRLNPNLLPAWLNLTLALTDRGKDHADAAIKAGMAATQLGPEMWNTHFALASAHILKQHHAKAARSLTRAVALAPGMPELLYRRAQCHMETYQFDEAISDYRAALALGFHEPGLFLQLSSLLQIQGDFDAARGVIADGLSHRPDNTDLAVAQYLLGDGLSAEQSIAAVEATLARADLDDLQRSNLHFSASAILAGGAEDDRGFAHLLAANRLRRRYETYDRPTADRGLAIAQGLFTAKLFAEKQGFGTPDDRMIFIFGMPRSGTTLTEQILASHPDVGDAGESRVFNHLRIGPSRIGVTPLSMTQVVAQMGPDETLQLAQTLVEFLPTEARRRSRTTEKTPTHYKYLGLLAILFPEARFIHCRRDPMDTCLSCFEQSFAHDNVTFSYDLEDLAYEYRIYHGYMDHWRRTLPVPMLELHYEQMIAEPERSTRALLAFSGLAWNDACLSFHETRRSVATASVRQVRQPIYTTSVAKWRRHERHLGPLITALGDLAPKA